VTGLACSEKSSMMYSRIDTLCECKGQTDGQNDQAVRRVVKYTLHNNMCTFCTYFSTVLTTQYVRAVYKNTANITTKLIPTVRSRA